MTLGYWKLVRWLQPALVILCVTFGYHARAADTQPYQVDFASTGNGDMDDTLKATSDLQTLRKSAPVSPFGLIARARSDIDRFTTVLESYGYYQSGVAIKINGLPLKDSKLRDTLSALPSGAEARVEVSFTLGPQYHLRKIDIDGELPDSARSTLGLKPGDAAVASTVLAGGARMLNALLEQGYAFAKVDAPVAYEAAEEPALDVNFHVVTGPRVNVGEIHIEGQKRTHEALLRRTLRVRTGDPYRLSAIERGRRDLLALGVFDLVTVQVGSAVDATGGVPITFKLRERKRHAASFSAAYSSDLGGSGGVTWTDRNLFGNAEHTEHQRNRDRHRRHGHLEPWLRHQRKVYKTGFSAPRPVLAAQHRRAQAVPGCVQSNRSDGRRGRHSKVVERLERERRLDGGG